MNPLRVLIATSNRQVVGGVEVYLRSLIPSLMAKGHQVGLLYEFPEVSPGPVVDAPDADIERWTAGSVEGTLRLVREWQPDVVYGHGLSSHGLEAAIARRFPMVLFAHGYYASCATGTKRH